MKLRLKLLLLIIFSIIQRTHGQDTTLLDENYMPVVQLEHAKFFSVALPNKSQSHKTVNLYDLKKQLISTCDTLYYKDSSYQYSTKEWNPFNNKLIEKQYGSYKPYILNETIIRYYENGKIQFKYQTLNNLLNGKVLSYWPSGKLKRKYFYKYDALVNGQVWNQKGKKVKHYPFRTSADFKMDIHQYFARNVHYTQDAQEAEVVGKIIVKFAIDTNGNVANIKILKPLYPSLDKEVIRVLKTVSNVSPATLDGLKIKSYFKIPISFNLID